MTYAENTSVPVERSRAEIERVVMRYGAVRFASGLEPGRAIIHFEVHDRRVRFDLPLPDLSDEQFSRTPTRRTRRSETDQRRAWEQACRQRWRALALCIKAKLEAVEAGITTFEEEFLAHIVLPNGSTLGQWAVPQLGTCSSSKMPPLLPGGGS